MLSFSKENIIVFNGEIYNAKYLKNFINQKNLKGTSDTEILLNLYEKIGPSVLEKIEGMFSFFVYTISKKNCFVARDRFGIKPLYFFRHKNYILFSSEIKPILSYNNFKNNFNNEAFADFFFKQQMDHEKKSFLRIFIHYHQQTFKIVSRKKTLIKKY